MLNSIKNHSDGFDSKELMTLALIVSDKLDITKSRLAKEGYNIDGMRQLQYISKVATSFSNNIFTFNFETDKNINMEELLNFYFIDKVFQSIKAFAKRIEYDHSIKINDKSIELMK